MYFLRRLLNTRQPMRHFALLDARGYCCALRQAVQAPERGRWVEVRESRMTWLDAPLPADALAATQTSHAQGVRALAA